MTNRHHNYMIRQVIYQMKRQYGNGPVDFHHITGQAVDLTTGEKVINKTVTRVTRAVCLPERAAKTLVQSISKISADKAFVYGGHYDTKARMFLVDQRDAPTLNLTTDDWIVYRGKKYDVKNFEEFELDTLWVVRAVEVVGDVDSTALRVSATNDIGLTSEAEAS